MRRQFVRDLVDARLRRAGQFELSARLERNRPAAGRIVESDQGAVVLDRLPAETRSGIPANNAPIPLGPA